MGYGNTARILHWLMAILVIAMFVAGNVMVRTDSRPLQDALFIFHKNTGVIVLLLLAFRFVWRLTHPAPPLPASVSRVQALAAHLTHWLLYFFLAVMVISGLVRVRAGGFPIEMFDAIGLPQLVPRSEDVANTAKMIHARAKFGLLIVFLMHFGAALMHGLFLRDGVFSRMWPPLVRRS